MYLFENMYLAHSLDEAFALFDAHSNARWIAGGSDVLIQLRNQFLPDTELISIQQIDSLRGIELLPDHTLRILPLTCFSAINTSPLVNRTVPALAYAAGQVGGPQIRNIGTIGGNICNGVTSADTAATLLAFDAQLELRCRCGVRWISIRDFYLGAKKVALQPGELLTAIHISQESYQDCWGKYIKFSTRRAMDIATLGCSVNVRLSEDKKNLARLRIAFGVAGPVPMRAYQTEEAFRGYPITPALPEQIGQAIQSEITPRDSWRATADYRRALAAELTQRALRDSIRAAGGDCP